MLCNSRLDSSSVPFEVAEEMRSGNSLSFLGPVIRRARYFSGPHFLTQHASPISPTRRATSRGESGDAFMQVLVLMDTA